MIRTFLGFWLALLIVTASPANAGTLYYSGLNDDGSTSIYQIDETTGVDSLLVNYFGSALNDLATSSVPNSIYGIDISSYPNSCLRLINVLALDARLIGCNSNDIKQIGYDANRRVLYATDNNNLYVLDTSSGTATMIGSFGGPNQMKGLTYDQTTNTLYGVNEVLPSGSQLYAIDTTTGFATLIGPQPQTIPRFIFDIYVDPQSGQMYGIGFAQPDGRTNALFSIDKATGVATDIATGLFDVGVGLAAPLAFGPLTVVPPGPINFGNQAVASESSPQTITLINSGDVPFTIFTRFDDSSQFPFKVALSCNDVMLLPGSSCKFVVTFAPTAIGPVSGSVAIQIVTSPDGGPTTQLQLFGNGILPGQLVISPANINFPNQTVGFPSAAQQVTLTNVGVGAVSITTAVASPGVFAIAPSPCLTDSLPPGVACIFTVTFTPDSDANFEGTVRITSSGSGSPQTIVLSGKGQFNYSELFE